jgi:hypothetical protein
MTRVGMKEPQMAEIARLFKRCLIDGKYVGDQVTEIRKDYQLVQYSFDQPREEDSPEEEVRGTVARGTVARGTVARGTVARGVHAVDQSGVER